jgi:hypothetical protein
MRPKNSIGDNMQRIFSTFFISILILTACAPIGNLSGSTNNQSANNVSRSRMAVVQTTSPNENTNSITKIKKPTPAGQNKNLNKNASNTSGNRQSISPTSTNPDFIATEIMGMPTDSSITINIVPAFPMSMYYEYGTSTGIYPFQTSKQDATAGQPLETVITGLSPNTRYYFRIRYLDKTGQERSFVTQRTPGSTFTFDIQGDSHPERVNQQFNSDLYKRTLLGAASDQPDFYMTIGDDFSVDSLKAVNADTVRALYINQRQWLGMVGSPVFLVNGNHEQEAFANLDGTADNVAIWAATARHAYFPQPAPDSFYSGDTLPMEHIGLLRDYYAFTWGDALFAVIDPYWHSSVIVDNPFGGSQKTARDMWDITLGDEQYKWLKNTLETSTSKFKFVFTHHVLGTGRGGIELAGGYEWGDAAGLAAHRPGWSKTIQQLMADNHVTIFFQGHDHIFVRQVLDGVIYQTLPEPANPNYTYENAEAYKSGDKFPNSGHVRITVASAGVTVEYIRSYLEKPDELAFSYTVK